MSSIEGRLTVADRTILLHLARQSIAHGLEHGLEFPIQDTDFRAPLDQPGASFVTLLRDEALRGCIGTLEPRRSLAADVASNAFMAAFRDPRFTPLTKHEADDLIIHIAVLNPAEPIACESEDHLLTLLRPGIDGLILEERGGRRSTFLPSVWESVPTPREFLQHLKLKAGLPAGYWSSTLRFERYTTESFS